MSAPRSLVLYRISNHADLSGEGGRLGSARWHTKGRPIVYMAENVAAAMLEQVVHMNDSHGRLPRNFTLLTIALQGAVSSTALEPPADSDWKHRTELTRPMGDFWLESRKTALARVPSALAPHTWNYLLNPEHPDAAKLRITEVRQHPFDPRLFGFRMP